MEEFEESIYEELEYKYCNMEFNTTGKLYFEAALAELDYSFDNGLITQREWAKLYQIIVDWKY